MFKLLKRYKKLSEKQYRLWFWGRMPGLVWATLDPNKKIYTVDSTNKKTAFQKLAIRELASKM